MRTPSPYQQVGYEIFGPVVVGFLEFVFQETPENIPIFFLSRDVTRFIPLAQKFFKHHGRNHEQIKHLYINRRFAKLALKKPTLTAKYLQQTLDHPRSILVDIGYHGSISSYLQELMPKNELETILFINSEEQDSAKTKKIRGFFSPWTLDAVSHKKITRNNGFIEAVLGDSGLGEFMGHNDNLKPIFGTCHISKTQLKQSDEIFDGINQYLEDYLAKKIKLLSTKKIWQDFIHCTSHPTNDFVQLFKDFCITDTSSRKKYLKVFNNTDLGKTESEKPAPHCPWHRNLWIGGKFVTDKRSSKEIDDYYQKLTDNKISVVHGYEGKNDLDKIFPMCL